MRTIKTLSLSLALAYAGTAASSEIEITIGHVDSQDWTTSKKVLLHRSSRILLKRNLVAVSVSMSTHLAN